MRDPLSSAVGLLLLASALPAVVEAQGAAKPRVANAAKLGSPAKAAKPAKAEKVAKPAAAAKAKTSLEPPKAATPEKAARPAKTEKPRRHAKARKPPKAAKQPEGATATKAAPSPNTARPAGTAIPAARETAARSRAAAPSAKVRTPIRPARTAKKAAEPRNASARRRTRVSARRHGGRVGAIVRESHGGRTALPASALIVASPPAFTRLERVGPLERTTVHALGAPSWTTTLLALLGVGELFLIVSLMRTRSALARRRDPAGLVAPGEATGDRRRRP
jgi:hypothetical protein